MEALGVGDILRFEESVDCLGVQLADNVASVVGSTAKKVTAACKANTQWDPESEWIMSLWSKLLDVIGLDNFKLVVSLQDQAMLLSVGRMFCADFPIEYRNNSVFNELFHSNLSWVYPRPIGFEVMTMQRWMSFCECRESMVTGNSLSL